MSDKNTQRKSSEPGARFFLTENIKKGIISDFSTEVAECQKPEGHLRFLKRIVLTENRTGKKSRREQRERKNSKSSLNPNANKIYSNSNRIYPTRIRSTPMRIGYIRTRIGSIPTRIGSTSKSLVDYIISDLPTIEGAVTYVSDTPLRTLKKTVVGHRATSAITNIKLKPQARVTIKDIFDKRNYRPELSRNHLSDWSNFYIQNWVEGMFSAFTDNFENALGKCVQKRNVLILNNEGNLWLHKNRITAETKKLYIKLTLNRIPMT